MSNPATPAPETTADPAFPRLHGRPPTGWLNDPNGCSRIDGTWHVFYQHNPHAPTHGDIHWGHMSSTDLLRWRTEPIAFGPRPGGPDATGCWSGSLVDDDGVPTAVYTAVDGEGTPSTVLARSDRDAVVFTRDEPPVAGMPRDPDLTDLRDPFLLTIDGHRYAVQGAGRIGGVGRVLVYRCDDLTDWREVGVLLRADHPALSEEARADIWECPSLVRIDGVWVLIVSIWRHIDDTHHLDSVQWVTGDLRVEGEGLVLDPTGNGRLDAGDAFYAPQALVVDDRVLLWGWSWETDHGSDRLAAAPWQGVLTYPRELALVGGRVVAPPVSEIEGLRVADAEVDALGGAFELLAAQGLRLSLDDVGVGPQDGSVVRALVDGSLVELVLADGSTVTTRGYPGARSRWSVTSDESVHAYALGL